MKRYTLSNYGATKFEVVDHAVRPAQHVAVLSGPLYAAYQVLARLNGDSDRKLRAIRRQLGVESEDLHAMRALRRDQ